MVGKDMVRGALTGAGLAAIGWGLHQGWGLGYPLLNLYGYLTFWFGVPSVFQFVHRAFGYGEVGKNLAFFGTVALWLFLHMVLSWLWRTRGRVAFPTALVLYALLGGWLAGLIYTGLLALFWWRKGGRTHVRSTGGRGGVSRRRLLAVLGVLAAGPAKQPGAQAQSATPLRISWDRVAGLSPEVTPQGKLYVVSKNLAIFDPNLKGRPYSLEVGGLVAKPLKLSLEELKALPASHLWNTLVCISNPVGGDLIGSARWTGVPVKLLLDRAGVKPQARWLVFEAADGYRESLPLAELPAQALIAYAINGEELEPRHGYPTRLILPGRYGMKQPKWLTRILALEREEVGYWAQRGWSRKAVIRTLSRIDVPKPGELLKVGEEVLIAGVAYAGGRPLERVEVSTDGGVTWHRAALKPPKGQFAWQLWALPWRPPTPGAYTLKVRAVEVGGRVQDSTYREPLPEGASGYHTVRVRAE